MPVDSSQNSVSASIPLDERVGNVEGNGTVRGIASVSTSLASTMGDFSKAVEKVSTTYVTFGQDFVLCMFPKDSVCARRLATERGSNCATGLRVNMIEERGKKYLRYLQFVIFQKTRYFDE